MKLLLVVNPAASSVTPRSRELVAQALEERHDVRVVETTARNEAVDLAGRAAGDGTEVVVVFGGDGTVNEAANGLVGTSTALAVVPGGSTNVFARTLGLPNRPGPAVERLVAALGAGSRRRVGVGRAGERHFLFHLGIGFDAAVVDQVERRSGLKRWLGQGVFLGAAVGTWVAGYDRRRARFAVRVADEPPVDAAFAVCLQTDPYTFLGPRPLTVAPGTGLDTGLAVLVLRDLRLSTLLGAGAAALGGGSRLPELAGVELRRDVERVVVDGYGPVPHQVDGDFLGLVESLEVTHRPDCLDLVVPS